MPTKRVPISRLSTGLNRAQRAFLFDEPLPDDAGPIEFTEHCALTGRDDDMPLRGHPTARELWVLSRGDVLPGWVRAHPGTRPPAWWRFDAPGPRQRVGGSLRRLSRRSGSRPVTDRRIARPHRFAGCWGALPRLRLPGVRQCRIGAVRAL
jgi:hypothetical protein